jgi:predicted transcriptional regulator
MTTMSIRVPDSLHNAIKDLATKEGYSMNQFLITAAAEKLSSLGTVDYLRARADRADLAAFERIMKKIPSGPPDSGDELPPKSTRRTRRRI